MFEFKLLKNLTNSKCVIQRNSNPFLDLLKFIFTATKWNILAWHFESHWGRNYHRPHPYGRVFPTTKVIYSHVQLNCFARAWSPRLQQRTIIWDLRAKRTEYHSSIRIHFAIGLDKYKGDFQLFSLDEGNTTLSHKIKPRTIDVHMIDMPCSGNWHFLRSIHNNGLAWHALAKSCGGYLPNLGL